MWPGTYTTTYRSTLPVPQGGAAVCVFLLYFLWSKEKDETREGGEIWSQGPRGLTVDSEKDDDDEEKKQEDDEEGGTIQCL